jgi:Protein of unknown function (DUF3089)
MKHALLFLLAVLFSNCAIHKPLGNFDPKNVPPPPDYSNPAMWSALPAVADLADFAPMGEINAQSGAVVDVFFLHPTTYTGSKRREKTWNGELFDQNLNKKTDGTIQYQATVFNGSARIYAPRYRQTHLHNFFRKNKAEDAKASLGLAHDDVRAAFDYYLKHYNNGRPIIIAGHSQGSYHGMILLKTYFDGKPLQAQLVAAYLPGWPIEKDFLTKIKPCENAGETGCVCSWRTYKRGFELKKWKHGPNIIVTNPISWTTEPGKNAPKSASKGAFLPKNKIYRNLCDAEIHDGILWTTRPKFRGSVFIRTQNYHPGDINLYYFDIRENVARRCDRFLKK